MKVNKKYEVPFKGFRVTEVRPGLFGVEREKRISEYNEQYGADNWEIGWKFDSRILNLDSALRLYEMSYHISFLGNRIVWDDLIKKAEEIWVEDKSDVDSGYDYAMQKAPAAHYEDIAIRRVLQANGKKFKGEELVRVRGDSDCLCGRLLSSMYVPFVAPSYIEELRLDGWWKKNTVEDFWQSNKIILVKKE